MFPSDALHNVTNRAFPDTKLATQLRNRVTARCIQSPDFVNLPLIQPCSPVSLALRCAFAKSDFVGMQYVFSSGAILKIIRSIVLLVAIDMIDFTKSMYVSLAWIERNWRLTQKCKCDQVVNLFAKCLVVFAQVYNCVVATLAALQYSQLCGPLSPCWVNSLNGSNIAERRHLVDVFKPYNGFPFFHVQLPPFFLNCNTEVEHCRIMCDWKAANDRSGGDFGHSIQVSVSRFGISEQLHAILINTAKELGWL